MIFNGKEVPFPAITKISFFKVIESLELMSKDKDLNVASFAENLLKEIDRYPILSEGFDDLKLLKKYKEPISKLSRILFPDALLTNEIKGLTPPFNFEAFYTSTRFRNILDKAGKDFSFGLRGYTDDLLYIAGCSAILGIYYQYPTDSGSPFVVEIPNKDSSITRSYRIAFNADLMEVLPTDKAIDISFEDYLELTDNFKNIDLWKKKFPPNSWVMRGIGIANLMDVTIDQSLSRITSNLLIKTEDTFAKVQVSLRTLFNNNDLLIGFATYENGAFVPSHKEDISSLILCDQEALDSSAVMCGRSHDWVVQQQRPMAVSDVNKFAKISNSIFSDNLKKQGIQSYIVAPLIYNDNFLGILEIGSKKKYELNSASLGKLDEVLPILSMAGSRFREEFTNRIEAIIQQECTTIHPAVKWRFEKEAKNYLIKKEKGENPHFDDVSFKEVYPLYGQLDLKGSSERRNEAVKDDLLTQMDAVKKVLIQAHKLKNMPVYEELIYRTDSYRKEIIKGLLAGSEQRILSFVKSEINPVFDHLKKAGSRFSELVDKYSSILDPNLQMVYDARRSFDESVTLINQTLASFLDNKQQEAQEMFPHYFERYKTDGIEYNMYIGQSIVESKTYDPIFLRNLRLWQLIVMCEMENKFNEFKKELTTSLEIASLILIYSAPLAIHFRMDEKRFDVEGTYNARYEIVKKRVDKAHIKGTKERITTPGKIAIIYSNEQDAQEYRIYIQFLQAKGYLKNKPIEDYELENLQGISGLRALRVELTYGKQLAKKHDLSIDQFLESIEKN